MSLREREAKVVAQTYGRYPMEAQIGADTSCNGEVIDFGSGIGVNSLGFCDSAWTQAVCEQAGKLQHTSNLYYTAPMVELAEKLCARTFAKKVFFANSGAEANEGLIKTARKYSSDKYGAGRHTILCLENSFHGRTLATLSATGQAVFHKNFGPFVEGFAFTPANDIPALEAAMNDGLCAVLVEFIQGEGGVVPLEADFVKRLAELCAERDLLLLGDEVQTGIGRTGKLLCHEHYGITPDAVSLAKGLGGGLPIGAVLFGEKCEQTLGKGDHGTTFGGNPVCCAGANVVLDRVDEAFLAEVCRKGAYLTEALLKLPHVVSVEGKGMMLGITMDGKNSQEVLDECLQKGLMVLTAKAKLRLLPPLNISDAAIDAGLNILKEVLSQ